MVDDRKPTNIIPFNVNVFISYNRQNSAFVTSITRRLKGDISIIKELFFDQDNLEGGQVWTDEIQQALTNSDACIVFIGEQGIGGWQNKEVLSAVNRYVDSKGAFKLIPVIIPHSKGEPVQKNFPWFLADIQWIEFLNETDPDSFQKLMFRLSEGEETRSVDPGIIPYKGLDFFDVADAALFFGRTFDLNWIFYKKLTLELTTANRFLAVVGDSGSGKSSFARAGILATIKAGKFPGSETWQQLVFSPEDNPLLKLSAALQSSGIIKDAAKMETDATSDPSSLRRALEVHGKRIVLMVDQFEELLTQCKDNVLRESFLKNITEALKSQYFVCIVTMRSDFYAAFSPFREFADMLEANNYTITSLDFNTGGEEWERYLRDIIQKPAKLLGVQFDTILTSQILEDCKRINGILPALQLALVELWKKRKDDKKIQSSDYDNLAHGKGIAGIIEEHANSIWKNLTKDESDKQSANLIKAIFIRLVEITSNKEDVRKTVNKAELINELSTQFTENDIEKTLSILSGINVRLIRIKQDKLAGGGSWVEVIHEALIRQWELLRRWLNERRDAITYKNKLEQYINDDNTLYRGKKLHFAEQWVNNNKDLTTGKINDFIRQSRGRVNKRKYILGVSIAAVFAIALSAWLYKPVYQCSNCELVKTWEDGNFPVQDVHTLVLNGTGDIKFTRCFNHLDTLILSGKEGENYISQENINELPKGLKFISIDGFGLSDSVLKFNTFSQLRSLTLSLINGLQRIAITNSDSLLELNLSALPNYKNLLGIDDLKNLRSLTLSRLNEIKDLSVIKKLPHLGSLNLLDLDITSFAEIENLQELRSLTIQGLNNITNLGDLKKMTGLLYLSLSVLPHVSSLSGIENLRNLQTLDFNLHLDSIPEIESLKTLRNLKLSEAKIADLSSIKSLVDIETLILDKLIIPNLQGLENLKKLRSLTLTSLGIRELPEIKNLINLRELYLYELQSIPGLEDLENLQLNTLSISSVPNFATLESIKNLKGLENLALSNLRITNLQGIENFGNLETLVLSELGISNLNGVTQCKKLHSMDLSFLKIPDLTGIENLKKLESLTISNTTDTHLEGIEKLLKLKHLSLKSMPAQNIGAISHLKKISFLSLQKIDQSVSYPIPTLKDNNVSDTLEIKGGKLDNLNFIDPSLVVLFIEHDNDIELANKEAAFKNKAGQMSRTKFINLSLARRSVD